jgi:hypothetical protein
MMRRLLATVTLTAVLGVLAVRAADDKKPGDAPKIDSKSALEQSRIEQERLKVQFEEFKNQLIRLADRLDSSDKKEDKDKAAILRRAIDKVNDLGTENKFEELVKQLKNSKEMGPEDLEGLLATNADLAKDIKAILDILMTDNRDAQLRAEIKRLEEAIKKLKQIIGQNERAGANLDRQNADLEKLQRDLDRIINQISDLSGKGKGTAAKENKFNPGEAKGEGKPGEAKGEGKDDTKEAKSTDKNKQSAKNDGPKADAKEGGKDGNGQKGDAKDGGKDGDSSKGDAKGGDNPDANKGDAKEGDNSKGPPTPGSAKEGKPGDENKPGEAKEGQPGEGQPGEGKKGDAAKGQSDSKGKGDGKSESKAGQGKSGSDGQSAKGNGQGQGQGQGQGSAKGGGQQANPSDPKQQPPTDLPDHKKILEGQAKEEDAEDQIGKKDPDKAKDDVNDANKKFREVLKKWEELLKQLREEEIERILAALQAQCEKMRMMQIQVRDGTVAIDKALQAYTDKKEARAENQRWLELADDEKEIVKLADRAITILQEEGTAVAFPEVFMQIRLDMMNVTGRLLETDVGTVTVTIENDIIATLTDMIEALKKARQDNGKPPPPGQGGGQNKQKLIDRLAELKMLRALEMRVYTRTDVYSKEYKGEQAPSPVTAPSPEEKKKAEKLQSDLKELAQRQRKIYEIADNIYKEKNK